MRMHGTTTTIQMMYPIGRIHMNIAQQNLRLRFQILWVNESQRQILLMPLGVPIWKNTKEV